MVSPVLVTGARRLSGYPHGVLLVARVGCVKRILCVKRPDESPAVVFFGRILLRGALGPNEEFPANADFEDRLTARPGLSPELVTGAWRRFR